MSVKIDVEYEGDLHCRSVHGPSGSPVCTDAPVDNGGRGELFSPTDLVAAGLGSCILTIMGLVGRKSGVDMTGATATVVKEMAASPSRRIGALLVEIRPPKATEISPELRGRLERAAGKCPVKESLHPDTVVELKWVWG